MKYLLVLLILILTGCGPAQQDYSSATAIQSDEIPKVNNDVVIKKNAKFFKFKVLVKEQGKDSFAYKNDSPTLLVKSICKSLKTNDESGYLKYQVAFQEHKIAISIKNFDFEQEFKKNGKKGEEINLKEKTDKYFAGLERHRDWRKRQFKSRIREINKCGINWDQVIFSPAVYKIEATPKGKVCFGIALSFVHNKIDYQIKLEKAYQSEAGWINYGRIEFNGPSRNERNAIGYLKKVMGAQFNYRKKNGTHSTLAQLRAKKIISIVAKDAGYVIKEIMKPNKKFYAVMMSPVRFNQTGFKHFIATSSGSIRTLKSEKHSFKDLPTTQESIDKINDLPLTK